MLADHQVDNGCAHSMVWRPCLGEEMPDHQHPNPFEPAGERHVDGLCGAGSPVVQFSLLTSMGIRVTPETLQKQLEMSGLLESLNYPYHKMIMDSEIPLSIGGGIGQERTYMLLLKKAHLGEVSNTVWPKQLKDICANKNIHVLQ